MHAIFAVRSLALLLLLCGIALAIGGKTEAATPLEVYGKLPAFENAALSASGNRIALIATIGEHRRLIVMDSQERPIFMAGVGDNKIRDIYWAGENFVLVRISATINLDRRFAASKAELQTMLVVSLSEEKSWQVFEDKEAIILGIRGFHGTYQRDGRWFGVFGGVTMERTKSGNRHLLSGHPDLYEVDLQDQGIRRIARRFEGGAGYFDWVLDASGKVAARLEMDGRNGSWRIKNAAGKELALGRNPQGNVEVIGLGRTADTIVFRQEDEATEGDRILEVPLAGGATTELFSDQKNLPWLTTDRRSRQLIGYLSDEDYPTDHFFAARHQKIMAAVRRAFPNLHVRLLDMNEAFDRLVVHTYGRGDPGTWWYVDISTGDAKDLGLSYAVAAADVAPVSIIQYKAADGSDISGVLTLPPGREPKALPVVILPHGGPAGRDYPNFDWWPQALASRGYAVFQPNFRGSTGYGAAFKQAGDGQWGRKMQTDTSDGFAELIRRGIVDPKRACIMGASYGGYVALAGVTLQQGLYRCAVAVAAVSDLTRFYNTEMRESGNSGMMARYWKDQLGRISDVDGVSPIRFAARADAPILLIHGKDDVVVNINQSMAMERALRQAGKPVALITLQGEDHWLSRGSTRLMMLKAAIDFIERHDPPDAAAKPAQAESGGGQGANSPGPA